MKKNKIIDSKSILKSVQKAIDKMILNAAALNEDIIISDGKGKPVRIKARSILKQIKD